MHYEYASKVPSELFDLADNDNRQRIYLFIRIGEIAVVGIDALCQIPAKAVHSGHTSLCPHFLNFLKIEKMC